MRQPKQEAKGKRLSPAGERVTTANSCSRTIWQRVPEATRIIRTKVLITDIARETFMMISCFDCKK